MIFANLFQDLNCENDLNDFANKLLSALGVKTHWNKRLENLDMNTACNNSTYCDQLISI